MGACAVTGSAGGIGGAACLAFRAAGHRTDGLDFADKRAVIGPIRAASGESAPRGIRRIAASPGWVETDFTDRARATLPDGRAIRACADAARTLNRLALPDEVAEAIAFFLSDAASFITGEELFVYGGLMRRK